MGNFAGTCAVYFAVAAIGILALGWYVGIARGELEEIKPRGGAGLVETAYNMEAFKKAADKLKPKKLLA